MLRLSKGEPMAMFQEADREREKTEAMGECQAEKIASLNMARLRALRLAKEKLRKQS